MLSKKGKRKLVFKGNAYYWYIKYQEGSPKIHIMSEDKKIQFSTWFDKEMILGSWDIVNIMERHLIKP